MRSTQSSRAQRHRSLLHIQQIQHHLGLNPSLAFMRPRSCFSRRPSELQRRTLTARTSSKPFSALAPNRSVLNCIVFASNVLFFATRSPASVATAKIHRSMQDPMVLEPLRLRTFRNVDTMLLENARSKLVLAAAASGTSAWRNIALAFPRGFRVMMTSAGARIATTKHVRQPVWAAVLCPWEAIYVLFELGSDVCASTIEAVILPTSYRPIKWGLVALLFLLQERNTSLGDRLYRMCGCIPFVNQLNNVTIDFASLLWRMLWVI